MATLLGGITVMDSSSIDFERYPLSPDQLGIIWEVAESFEREWHLEVRVADYLERVPARPRDLRAALEDLLTRIDRVRRQGLGSTGPPVASAPDAGRLPECPGSFGEFQVECELGRGTYGFVYRAWWEPRQRHIALKVLAPKWTHQPKARRLFFRESGLAAALHHPRIVPVYVADEQNGLLFIAYQLIEGVNLAKSRWMSSDRSDPVRAVREIILPVLEAVHAAHHVGVIHRDLKPANILLDGKGRPFVTDFGMAATDRELAWGREDGFAGTLHYMAPEQLNNEGQKVGERTDIYAIGVIMYELLTGKRPFEAQTEGQLRDLVMEREPLSPRTINPEIPRALNQTCLRAMRREIADRYSDCDEFAEALRQSIDEPTRIGAAEGTAAPLPDPQVTVPASAGVAPPRAAGRRLTATVVFSVLLTLAALVVIGLWVARLLPRLDPSPVRSPVRPTDGLEREVAAITVRAGGWLDGTRGDDNENIDIRSIADIPDVPFTITGIYLSHGDVGDEFLEIASRLPRLDYLELHRTGVTDAGVAHLGRCRSLRKLDLRDLKGVTDQSLKTLVGLPELETLKLSGTAVSDRGLPSLQGLKGLRVLFLERTTVTSDGMPSLARLKSLQKLDLRWTAVNDRGLAELEALEDPRKIYVKGTKITEPAICRFECLHPGCDVNPRDDP